MAPGRLAITYEYDLLGRLAKVTNPYGQAIESRYHAAGTTASSSSPCYGTVSSAKVPSLPLVSSSDKLKMEAAPGVHGLFLKGASS